MIKEILTGEIRLPNPESKLSPETNFSQRVCTVVNYFRISPQIHLPNIFLLSVDMGITMSVDDRFILAGLLLMTNAVIGCNLLNARNNLPRYRRTRRVLSTYGWDERLIEPMTKTLCGRNVARIAAIDAGFENEVTAYYKSERLNDLLPICDD